MTPGQVEHAESELAAAEEELRAARLLVDQDLRRPAVSRMYYAAFHAVRAVLTLRGEHAKTHSGQITHFERTHGPTPLLGRLLELRGKADYGTDFSRSREQLDDDFREVEELVARCRGLVAERAAQPPDEADPPADT